MTEPGSRFVDTDVSHIRFVRPSALGLPDLKQIQHLSTEKKAVLLELLKRLQSRLRKG